MSRPERSGQRIIADLGTRISRSQRRPCITRTKWKIDLGSSKRCEPRICLISARKPAANKPAPCPLSAAKCHILDDICARGTMGALHRPTSQLAGTYVGSTNGGNVETMALSDSFLFAVPRHRSLIPTSISFHGSPRQANSPSTVNRE